MAELGMDFLGPDQGGSGCPDIGEDLHGGGSSGHALRVGDMSNETAHQEVFGDIPPQGGTQAYRETTFEWTGL